MVDLQHFGIQCYVASRILGQSPKFEPLPRPWICIDTNQVGALRSLILRGGVGWKFRDPWHEFE